MGGATEAYYNRSLRPQAVAGATQQLHAVRGASEFN